MEEADILEEELGCEIRKTFCSTEKGILSVIAELNNKVGNPSEEKDLIPLLNQAREYLAEQKYDVKASEKTKNFADFYKLSISSILVKKRGVVVYSM